MHLPVCRKKAKKGQCSHPHTMSWRHEHQDTCTQQQPPTLSPSWTIIVGRDINHQVKFAQLLDNCHIEISLEKIKTQGIPPHQSLLSTYLPAAPSDLMPPVWQLPISYLYERLPFFHRWNCRKHQTCSSAQGQPSVETVVTLTQCVVISQKPLASALTLAF